MMFSVCPAYAMTTYTQLSTALNTSVWSLEETALQWNSPGGGDGWMQELWAASCRWSGNADTHLTRSTRTCS